MEQHDTLRRLTLLSWLGVLVTVIAGAEHLGTGPLAPPPLADPGAWPAWAAERTPADVAFALLRLVVVALAWYLLASTGAGLAARLARAGTFVAAADRLTLPAVRRLLSVAVGTGLAAAALAPARLAHRDLARPAVTLAAAQADPAAAGQAPGRATMRLLPPDPGPAQVEAPAGARWVVRPGQHLWSIAHEVLAAAWGRHPGDAEIVPYWRALVEANRSTLADPANPDLIFPAQVFTLPPVPAAP